VGRGHRDDISERIRHLLWTRRRHHQHVREPGGGVIGGGSHETVAQATQNWLVLTEEMLDLLPSDSESHLPPTEQVVPRALTYEGRKSITALEDDLAYDRHPPRPVFHAAHDVITELRRVDERAPPGGRPRHDGTGNQ
jgi:hypothetical protein